MLADRLRRTVYPVARGAGGLVARRWEPHSRLFLVGEGLGWAIDEDMQAIGRIARRLGIVSTRIPLAAAGCQTVFYGSQFMLFGSAPLGHGHRVATAYFHGRPGTPGAPEFDDTYEALRARHREVHRVQVSHREMETIVLESGIEPEKVFRIPIGVEPSRFAPQTPGLRAEARTKLGLPIDAFVVGSFQKDGVGWGDGREPKMIKGPDILVETLVLLRQRVPELHVLLSGPARGYVRAGLERNHIPYVHRLLNRHAAIGLLYHALDAYVVPARQEGGPKGVLEAMASGVPLVSTRVGQATDLVRNGENGWLVDVEDVEALADALVQSAHDDALRHRVTEAGLETAAAHAYDAQLPLWRAFFDGFVEHR